MPPIRGEPSIVWMLQQSRKFFVGRKRISGIFFLHGAAGGGIDGLAQRSGKLVRWAQLWAATGWQAFSSTSLFPHDDSYHRERRFVRYCLQLPAGMPVLRMERLSEVIHNEADEVLLPPVRGIVSQARSGLEEVALAVHEWRIWFCAEDALGVRES